MLRWKVCLTKLAVIHTVWLCLPGTCHQKKPLLYPVSNWFCWKGSAEVMMFSFWQSRVGRAAQGTHQQWRLSAIEANCKLAVNHPCCARRRSEGGGDTDLVHINCYLTWRRLTQLIHSTTIKAYEGRDQTHDKNSTPGDMAQSSKAQLLGIIKHTSLPHL
jgi:hypothetical protein